MNKRKTGKAGEDLAVEYLESRGVSILQRNFYTRFGEIDIVGSFEGYIVFLEVKFRADDKCGDPAEAVGANKIRRIVSAARYYLYKNRISEDSPIRFDVIAITGDKVNWIQNAFEAF